MKGSLRKSVDNRMQLLVWGGTVWICSSKPNIYSFYPLIAIDGSKDLSPQYNSQPKQFNPSLVKHIHTKTHIVSNIKFSRSSAGGDVLYFTLL